MNWLLVAYLLALTIVSCQAAKIGLRGSLWLAWVWLAAIPFSHFAMALFRAGNFRNPRDMVLVEIWSDGFAWLFLGLSMLCLGRVFRDSQRTGER
jgi:tellurite resistance protein TehA-like permease